MNFEVGKAYGGYTIEARTACFVTIGGARKKISVSADGIETIKLNGFDRFKNIGGAVADSKQFIVTAKSASSDADLVEVALQEEATIWIEPSANPIVKPQPVSGAKIDEPIVIKDVHNQEWRLVSADLENCLFEAVEQREIGCEGRTRTMPLKAVQALYGWGKPKRDTHVRPCNDHGMGIQVYCDDRRNGYALAEPIWYKRTDDLEYSRDIYEREQSMRDDYDCDRAANFSMSTYRGTCGGMV